MDKKVFLLDKQHYQKEMVENLTEKDLEEWVAEEDYDDNYTIIKIDATMYDSPDAAIVGELNPIDGLFDINDYYMFTFGFS
jgi:hypothetical protein